MHDPRIPAGWSPTEYAAVVRRLGRHPNAVEATVLSALFSEHCAYKSSRAILARLPRKGGALLEGPGENAGIVAIGGGWALAFKIESHNHPSFIEPYQGAATGVGGIVRDILAMGARPIALLDALFFAPPGHERSTYLIERVVAGIGGYGNAIGVPTVGGKTCFDARYARNILVNVLCVGLLPADRIVRGVTGRVGNVILYVGARTGRDGLHGATMASRGFAGATEGARPAVQVGDPFAGKRLIEATLAVVEAGLVAGMQDLGAAGLASALFEMANRSGTGITVDLARVPLRQRGLSPTEILLSESQERMVIAADPAAVPRIAEHFQRWDLCCVPIGEVTPGVSVAVRFGGARVLELPASFVGEDAPRLDRPRRAPPAPPPSRRSLPAIPLDDPAGTLLAFLATPQLAARNVIYEQFDHGVQLRAIDGGGSPAPLLRLPETGERIAVVLHVPPLLPTISPRTLGRMAVLGAALRLACRGARPLGLTDGLNFGSPEDPHVMWRFAEVVSGIAEACERFEIPVTGGNVSFYNETRGVAIPPTPVVGMIGGVRGEAPDCVFREAGEILLLIGRPQPGYCWAYQTFRGMEHPSSPDPPLDLGQERRRLAAILSLSRHLRSLRLVTAGGLARAIVAAALDAPEPIGVRVDPPPGLERATFLFSEWPPTLLATTTQGAYHEVAALLRSAGIPCHPIGRVGGDRISIGGAIDLPIDRVERVWRGALERILQERKD